MKNWKRILCGVIAGMMIAAAPVQAAVLDAEVKATIETNDIPPWPKASDIAAEAGFLMEYSTGTVIFSKGADQRIAPSGTTKLMTLLIAAENSNLEDQVTVTQTGMRDLNPDDGAMALQLGETLPMKHCMQLMLLASSNQAAAQIAEQVGGTEAQFIQMMNDKAKALGCENTNFTNASGLPDPNQYTTAEDLAKIYRAGLKNKIFSKIMKLKKASIPPTNLTGTERVVSAYKHPIMSRYSSLYDKDCTGGGFGQSEEVGCNLVTSVRKNGVLYIAVVMKEADSNQAGLDSQYLLKYGYENFQKVAVEGGSVVIPNGSSVADLRITEKKAGEKVRQFYFMADHRVGRGEKAAAAEPAAADPAAQSGDGLVEAQSEGEAGISPVEEAKLKGLSQTARILLAVMAVMAVVLLILIILLAIKDYKDARRYDEDDE